MVLGAFRNGAVGVVVPHGSKVMGFSRFDPFQIEEKKNKKGVQHEDFPGGHPS